MEKGSGNKREERRKDGAVQRSHGLEVFFGKVDEHDVYLHHRCFPKASRLPRQEVMAAAHPCAPSCWSRANILLNHKITHSEKKKKEKRRKKTQPTHAAVSIVFNYKSDSWGQDYSDLGCQSSFCHHRKHNPEAQGQGRGRRSRVCSEL